MHHAIITCSLGRKDNSWGAQSLQPVVLPIN